MSVQRCVVEALGAQGDGVVVIDGKTIHVPRVLPGELIEFSDGLVGAIVQPSPDRASPFCSHYDRCGGCSFQHMSAACYVAWKRDRVEQALRRNAIECPVADVVDAHGAGRRRVTLHVRQVDGVWRAGFMAGKSHSLVPIRSCPVLDATLDKAILMAAQFGPILGPCDVSITATDLGLDVAVKAERAAVARRAQALVQIFETHGVCRLAVNGETVAARGEPFVSLDGVKAFLPPLAFLQATRKGEYELANRVLAACGKARRVADLFCGIGTFSLRLARQAAVHGFDSDRPAIDSLRKSARLAQGLKPVEAETRNLFAAPLVPSELKAFDAVVLDPPRAGALAQVKNLAHSEVGKIVYVSCDPESFARDARILVDAGFGLGEVIPVDQFKWSQHIELVGVFLRKGQRLRAVR